MTAQIGLFVIYRFDLTYRYIYSLKYTSNGSDGHRSILKKRIPKIAGKTAGLKISATYSLQRLI